MGKGGAGASGPGSCRWSGDPWDAGHCLPREEPAVRASRVLSGAGRPRRPGFRAVGVAELGARRRSRWGLAGKGPGQGRGLACRRAPESLSRHSQRRGRGADAGREPERAGGSGEAKLPLGPGPGGGARGTVGPGAHCYAVRMNGLRGACAVGLRPGGKTSLASRLWSHDGGRGGSDEWRKRWGWTWPAPGGAARPDPATGPAGEARLLPLQADLNKTKRSWGEAGFRSLAPACSRRRALASSLPGTSQLVKALTAGRDTVTGTLYLPAGGTQ